MPSNYWIKLYHEILDDAKMGKLSDRLWRRTIELFLMAGDNQQDGELPSLQQMSWRLRTSDEALQEELAQLERLGIVTMNGEIHLVTNFEKRQAAMEGAERTARYRDKKRKDDYYGDNDATEDVTNRHTEENRIDKNRIDKEKTDTLYSELKTEWKRLFPSKPQPRTLGNQHRHQLNARRGESFFMDNWREALKRASKIKVLHSSDKGWFDFWWMIEKEEHIDNLYNGKYVWMDKSQHRSDALPVITPVTAKDM